MSRTLIHPHDLARPKSSTRTIDMCVIVPIVVCALALIVIPLIQFLSPPTDKEIVNGVSRPENRILWPVMAAISVILAMRNRSRLAKITWPPHIICFIAYLAFAGMSALWAFRPEISLIRFIQQVMIVISIVLPAMLADRTSDMMRGLFLCFALAMILNVFFVIHGTETIVLNAGRHGLFLDPLGSPGYFSFKNYLGECAAIGFLLSIHEILHRGWRRVLGIVGTVIAAYLVFASNSKTSFGLASICPFLAALVLIIRRSTRVSLAIILLSIPFGYVVLSTVSPHYNLNLISYKLYGDGTFTGRTIIWDFVQSEINLRPLLGWGYESFWLVPGSPAIVDAPGWVKGMPNGHNGYYDTILDMGYLGFAFLLVFIIGTLHSIGRVADRDPIRAWLLLSLALFIILWNFLERLWMHGFEFLWVVFVIVAAEIGRYWRPFPITRVAYGSRGPRPRRSSGPPLAAQTPRLSTMMRHHD
jgi:exopolysaccharide production protein ExoQ